jgi:hypothetical protein
VERQRSVFVSNKPENRFFILFSFHLGANWAPLNDPRKVNKGLQVGKMYGPIAKLTNKPITKSLGPFFKEKWSVTTKKQLIILYIFFHFGAICTPPN